MVDKTTDNKNRIISLYRPNYLAQFHVREMAKLTKKSESFRANDSFHNKTKPPARAKTLPKILAINILRSI